MPETTPDSGEARYAKIVEALDALDHANDDHWTQAGRPRISVLSRWAKFTVAAADLDAVAPTYDRDQARTRAEKDLSVLFGDRGEPATPSPTVAALPETAKPKIPKRLVKSVLQLPTREILDSAVLRAQAHVEIDETATKLIREREQIANELRRLSALTEILDRRDALERPDESRFRNQVRDMQKRSAESRGARAESARRFLRAGTTREAVLNELDPRAPIDKALNARRGSPASKRPAPVTPAHVSA